MPAIKIPRRSLSDTGLVSQHNRSFLFPLRRCLPTRQCIRSVVVVPRQTDRSKSRAKLEDEKPAAQEQEDVDARQYQIQKSRIASHQRDPSRPSNDAPRRTPPQDYGTKVFSVGRDDRAMESTMTDRELNTFNRLFRSIKGDSAPQRGHAGIYAEDLGYDEDRAAEDAMDLDIEQDVNDSSAQKVQVNTSSPKVEAYPKALQGMAREVYVKRQMTLAKRAFTKDPQMRQVIDLTKPIMFRLADATTDVEVWDVLEQEIFSKVRLMNLDDESGTKDLIPSSAKSKKQPKKEKLLVVDGMSNANDQVTSQNTSRPDLHIFSMVYQRVAFHASRILCKRTSYTPLAVALLPAIKALGPSSYAMGVSSGLFNELLLHNWRVYNSMTPMLSLLTEMDRITVPMNSRTLEALEEVTLYRTRAEKGNYGEAVRQFELSADRRREGRDLWSWKKRIQDRVQEEALEKSRRLEQERALRDEGALGDEDEGTSALLATG